MRWLRKLWAKIEKWWRKFWKQSPRPIKNFVLEIIEMDIVGTWTLPTVRDSGGPLPIEEISHTMIEVTLDGGVTWTELVRVPPTDPQEFRITDAEVGTWGFQGTVVDTNNRSAPPVSGTAVVPDETAPGPITDFNITLE